MSRRNRLLLALGVVIVLGVLAIGARNEPGGDAGSTPPAAAAGGEPTPTATPAEDAEATDSPGAVDSPTPSPSPVTAGSAAALLETLKVAPEHKGGYKRELFHLWIDADGDGCNTRAEVLLTEALTQPTITGRCRLEGGSWRSPYDGVTYGPKDACGQTKTTAGCLDIDHLVPLAEAWRSGAWAWTADRRQDYANDLGDPRTLIAVTSSVDRAKGDKDPASWLPPAGGAETCRYASDWIAVKARWGLTVDRAEHDALSGVLAGCPMVPDSVVVVP
jgi:hypothetical protein